MSHQHLARAYLPLSCCLLRSLPNPNLEYFCQTLYPWKSLPPYADIEESSGRSRTPHCEEVPRGITDRIPLTWMKHLFTLTFYIWYHLWSLTIFNTLKELSVTIEYGIWLWISCIIFFGFSIERCQKLFEFSSAPDSGSSHSSKSIGIWLSVSCWVEIVRSMSLLVGVL